METPHKNDISDDEIFFGKLSLKEFKKHVLYNTTRHLSPCPAISTIKQEDHDKSLKLIETHSQPNLLSSSQPFAPISPAKSCDWSEKELDDSFVNIENMVEKLCLSPSQMEAPGLNNTLEVIEYILNNGPPKSENVPICVIGKSVVKNDFSPQKSECKSIDEAIQSTSSLYSHSSPTVKVESGTSVALPQTFITPAKMDKEDQLDVFVTPSSDMKPVRHLFKTPAQPLSLKKPSASSLKKTPSKSNVYQHITSPIASYINQSPRVPLVKDIHPRKPLPCSSSIPKLQKSIVKPKLSNKENVNFPSIAYKSAKKTKIINVPDEEKLPQNQWIKKITSSLPRPVVMKHDHREHNIAKKQLKPQEDSFADLSCHQADVSICTQKSAFKLNKHF